MQTIHDASSPCPVCQRTSGKCKQPRPGFLLCRNTSDGVVGDWFFFKVTKSPDFAIWINDRLSPSGYEPCKPATPRFRSARDQIAGVARPEHVFKLANFHSQVERLGKEVLPVKSSRHRELAKVLGLDLSKHLVRIHDCRVWGEDWWAFPTVDEKDEKVGYTLRNREGDKRTVGTNAGLIVPVNTAAKLERSRVPLHVVTGASDVLTVSSAGGVCVGVLSDNTGLETLVNWIQRNVTGYVDLRVIAENDYDPRRPERGWPGLEAAQKRAHALADRLGCPVAVILPPQGCKDARAWMQRILMAKHKIGPRGNRTNARFTPARLLIELDRQVELGGYDDNGEAVGDNRYCWIIRPGQTYTKPCVFALAGGTPENCGCPKCGGRPGGPSDYSDLEKFDPSINRQEVTPHTEEEEAAHLSRFALPPLPPCSYTISLRHRTENKGRVVGASCGRWACPHCAPGLKKEWIGHVRHCLAPLVAPLFVQNYPPSDWLRIYRQIQRAGGRFFKCIDGDCLLIVSTVPFDGAFELPVRDALAHLEEAIGRFPPCRKPISACKAWNKPQQEESGEWKRDAKLSWHSTLPRCADILREAGIEPTVKIPSGQEQKRRYLEFDFPNDATQSQVDNVFMCLWMGEWIPDAAIDVVDTHEPSEYSANPHADVFPD